MGLGIIGGAQRGSEWLAAQKWSALRVPQGLRLGGARRLLDGVRECLMGLARLSRPKIIFEK